MPTMLSNATIVNILTATLMLGATLVASAPDASANPTPSVHWMKLHDGIIAFDDSGGKGPIIICVPGLGDLRQQYRFLAPRLESAGFRVITMDVRGHGASSVNWPDYSAAAVGGDIVTLSHHLGAQQGYGVGSSLAGPRRVWCPREN